MLKRKAISMVVLAAVLLLVTSVPSSAQWGLPGRPGGLSGAELLSRFDADGDGTLDDTERKQARAFIQSTGRQGRSSPVRVAARMPALESDLRASAAAAPRSPAGLYDEATLRTLYLRFPTADWYEELADFYGSDIDVPADLVVDGRLYPGVGVRFRGNSSYQMTGDSLKKSFNVSVDYRDGDQRLLGYRTLNLLNAANDPSFVREVLYNRIARSYLPAMRANFVRLVINGESWGVYVNVQQFNPDFTNEWFGSTAGNRWKVPAGGGAGRGGWGAGNGFVYLGTGTDRYRISYELKSTDRPEAWRDLVRLCQVLAETPDARLEEELAPLLDIDGALWFLALENVFVDGDGYLSRGSDFSLYQDAAGRFHLVPYDSNETFRWAGGGGPNDWGSGSLQPDPLAHADSDSRPLVKRLLSLPSTRARYLAHVRTIVDQWLDWDVLEPVAAGYQALIDAAVEADDKKLFSYQAFQASLSLDAGGSGSRAGFGGSRTPGLRQFVTDRRAFLESHEALRRQGVAIASASGLREVPATEAGAIVAEISGGVRPAAVLLHWAAGPLSTFSSVLMTRGSGGAYTGRIPAQPAGTEVRWYVETRTSGSPWVSTFWPAGAEGGALSYRVTAPVASSSAVRINEVSAAAGRGNDWIELANTGTVPVDLSLMFLSDDPGRPRRWAFPAGTIIPAGGRLVVRAGDGTAGASALLNTGFGLSAGGETLLLVDTDARGNAILDTVTFAALAEGTSWGRLPDGSGSFRTLSPTPGKPNEP